MIFPMHAATAAVKRAEVNVLYDFAYIRKPLMSQNQSPRSMPVEHRAAVELAPLLSCLLEPASVRLTDTEFGEPCLMLARRT